LLESDRHTHAFTAQHHPLSNLRA